jgi:hypothetical protein
MRNRPLSATQNFAITATALVLFYPLSVGPVAWAAVTAQSDMARRVIKIMYAPLFWTLERSPTLIQDAFMHYLASWIGRFCC